MIYLLIYGCLPIPPAPGDRWTTDRGVMPGELFSVLDQNEDGSSKLGIVERVSDDGKSLYELIDPIGQSLGVFKTVDEAAGTAEFRFPFKELEGKNETTVSAVPRTDVSRPLKKSGIAGPLTLYHGTDKEFDTPNISGVGAHFGTKQQAEFMAKYREGLEDGGNGVVKTYEVDIKNPIRMHDTGFTNADLMMRVNPPDTLKNLPLDECERLGNGTLEDIKNKLIELGYDGVVYSNTTEEGAGNSYIAFHPEQIKPVPVKEACQGEHP